MFNKMKQATNTTLYEARKSKSKQNSHHWL